MKKQECKSLSFELLNMDVDSLKHSFLCNSVCWSFEENHIKSIQIRSSGPRQANLVLIAYASSKGSGEPAHPCSFTRTSVARSYKQ